jgi:aspartyl/asparaginyl beta-hydroxylase (cupin superfamily)
MARNLALHPGFPAIGAIDIFRANVQRELNDAQRYFERELQAMSNENRYGLFGSEPGKVPRNQTNVIYTPTKQQMATFTIQ